MLRALAGLQNNGSFNNPTFTGAVSGGAHVMGVGANIATPADTTEDVLASITIPANSMGANGCLRIVTLWTFTNSVNNKTMRVRFSGASGTIFATIGLTTQVTTRLSVWIQNTATNAQNGGFEENHPASGPNQTFGTTAAVDTTAATTVVITGQKATGSETLTLNNYMVEILKP